MPLIYILILLIFSACATEYQQVLIPTTCDIPKRNKPLRSGDILQDFKAVLIYSELIEQDLNFCRGEHKPP